MSDFILASRSPRRRELLAGLGLAFDCTPADIDETRRVDESAEAFVERLARGKAAAVAASTRMPVLGADTEVVIDGETLGKPAGESDTLAMLERLSGRTHEVLTGIAVTAGNRTESRVVRTRVTLRDTTSAERAAYHATGEPADKAGAYAIQGLGAIFVAHIEGSYTNVVGLPLFETVELLGRFGVDVLDERARGPGPGAREKNR